MGNFQGGGNRGGGFRGGNGGGRPSFGGNRGGDRREVSMHKATCDECHKSCEVPFRPSGDKPVYCSDCFSNKRDDGDRAPRREFRDNGHKRDFSDRQAPSFTKPATMPSNDGVSKQLSEISTKLDRLTSAIEKLITPKTESKPVVKVAEVKKVEIKKAPVVKAVAKKAVTVKAPVKKVVAKKKK
ncbi:MAG: CxxC-x17-CxxC domain-containing protein [Candidatus Paceibacterota bacterium]